MQMPFQLVRELRDGRRLILRIEQLRINPRISQRSAGDHNSGTTGFLPHLVAALPAHHASVGDHRNGETLPDGPDHIKCHRPGIECLHQPSVKGESLNAGLFQTARKLNRRLRITLIQDPGLHGNRDPGGPDDQ